MPHVKQSISILSRSLLTGNETATATATAAEGYDRREMDFILQDVSFGTRQPTYKLNWVKLLNRNSEALENL